MRPAPGGKKPPPSPRATSITALKAAMCDGSLRGASVRDLLVALGDDACHGKLNEDALCYYGVRLRVALEYYEARADCGLL